MIIDTMERRQSKLIVGILVITVFAICVAFASECGGQYKVKQDDYYLPNSNNSSNLIEDSSGNKEIVTVAQGKWITGVDTEKGKIEIVQEVLPNWQVLPLCITDDLLDPYWVTIKVTGGYHPYDGWFIDLYQDNWGGKNTKEFVGRIDLIHNKIDSGCCYDIYNITFDVCGPCIELDSNHFPDIPAGWNLIKDVCGTETLNKLVDIQISTHWYGCGERYQRFELILSQ